MEERPEAFALLLDGKGGARPVPLERVRDLRPEDGSLWVHLPPELPDLLHVLEETCGMPASVREQLLAPTERVRVEPTSTNEVVLLIVEPDVSPSRKPPRQLRAWVAPHRCVTVGGSGQPGVASLRLRLKEGRGPRSADVLQSLADSALATAAHELGRFDDRLVDLELRSDDPRVAAGQVRDELRALRRTLIEQRCFLSLARDALLSLDVTDILWVTAQDRDLRRVSDRAGALLQELGVLVDRARILDEDLKAHQDERTQRTLYLLTLISGVFLPLTFITGLLGVNLAGIPGSGWKGAFLVLCVLLVGLAVAEWRLLRRRNLV